MPPDTDIVDIAARAFAPATPLVRARSPHARAMRRIQARGRVWVRITLTLVVSALLLSIVVRSKTRSAGPADVPAPPAVR